MVTRSVVMISRSSMVLRPRPGPRPRDDGRGGHLPLHRYHTPLGAGEPHAWRSLRIRTDPADDVARSVEELDARRAVRLHRHTEARSSPAVHEHGRRVTFRGPPDEHARRAERGGPVDLRPRPRP